MAVVCEREVGVDEGQEPSESAEARRKQLGKGYAEAAKTECCSEHDTLE